MAVTSPAFLRPTRSGVPGVGCLAWGVWYEVSGMRCLVWGVWYEVSGVGCLV